MFYDRMLYTGHFPPGTLAPVSPLSPALGGGGVGTNDWCISLSCLKFIFDTYSSLAEVQNLN